MTLTPLTFRLFIRRAAEHYYVTSLQERVPVRYIVTAALPINPGWGRALG
jgi:hypothetical protein